MRTLYFYFFQNIFSTIKLTVTRVLYLEQIVSVTTQISRAISLIKELWIKHIVSTIIYIIPPIRVIYELPSPPYSYFEFFTHLENVVLLLIVIGAIATISSIYIWRHRKEVWKRPKQKYEEALKS
jgi:Na+-driven multidrug efflux pump